MPAFGAMKPLSWGVLMTLALVRPSAHPPVRDELAELGKRVTSGDPQALRELLAALIPPLDVSPCSRP